MLIHGYAAHNDHHDHEGDGEKKGDEGGELEGVQALQHAQREDSEEGKHVEDEGSVAVIAEGVEETASKITECHHVGDHGAVAKDDDEEVHKDRHFPPVGLLRELVVGGELGLDAAFDQKVCGESVYYSQEDEQDEREHITRPGKGEGKAEHSGADDAVDHVDGGIKRRALRARGDNKVLVRRIPVEEKRVSKENPGLLHGLVQDCWN